jgi:chorismate mutase/prephenate dehydrogenase
MIMGLDELREEIKKADMEILEAMRKRLDVAKRIGEYKIGSGKEIRDISVEERVVGRYRDFASANGMDPDVAERVCRAVIEESVAAQASMFQADGRHRKVSVVGGSGKMGGWFSKMLSAFGDTVEIIDPASDNGLTLSDASSSDVVIVSVPISVTGDILERLDGICGPDALIFDLTSLKTPIIPVLKDMASRRKVCSVHPMFGPSAESMYDRNVIICDCGCKVAVSEAVSILGNRGGNIRIMDVDSHDRYVRGPNAIL